MKKYIHKNLWGLLKSKTVLAVSGGMILMSCGVYTGGYSETDGVYYDPNTDTLPEGIVMNDQGNMVGDYYDYQDYGNIVQKSRQNELANRNRYQSNNWSNGATSSDWGAYTGSETRYSSWGWGSPFGFGMGLYPRFGWGGHFGMGFGWGSPWGWYDPFMDFGPWGFNPYFGYSSYGYYSPYYGYGYSPYYGYDHYGYNRGSMNTYQRRSADLIYRGNASNSNIMSSDGFRATRTQNSSRIYNDSFRRGGFGENNTNNSGNFRGPTPTQNNDYNRNNNDGFRRGRFGENNINNKGNFRRPTPTQNNNFNRNSNDGFRTPNMNNGGFRSGGSSGGFRVGSGSSSRSGGFRSGGFR